MFGLCPDCKEEKRQLFLKELKSNGHKALYIRLNLEEETIHEDFSTIPQATTVTSEKFFLDFSNFLA